MEFLVPTPVQAELTDEEIVERVLSGDTPLFEIIMRRYNQRLYRVARGILKNDTEAEDVMQDAYVRAYAHLGQFAGRAKFSTWLTRIAVHEALARVEKQNRNIPLPEDEDRGELEMKSPERSPEELTSTDEMRRLLEETIDSLPTHYRSVFVLRSVEQLSTEDAATALGLSPDVVKIRLHRARAILRKRLYERAGITAHTAFPFHAVRCDRVVANVMHRIAAVKMEAEGE